MASRNQKAPIVVTPVDIQKYKDQPVSSTNPVETTMPDPANTPVTIGDGDNAVEGALADAAIVTDVAGTINGKLRGLVKLIVDKITVKLDTGSNVVGKVGIDQTTPGTTDQVSVATGQGAGATIGAVADAAVVTDANGTISGKLRGIIKLLVDKITIKVDGVTQVGGQLPVVNQPYLFAVAEGDIAGHTLLRKLGRAPGVSTTLIDVCVTNAVIPMIGAEMQMSLKSTSANDDGNPAGTGAQIVSIDYLDDAYVEHTEDVTLDGTTWVDTVASDFFRIQSMHVKAAGTGGLAAGTITLVDKATRAIIYDQIDVGYNRSLRCLWTVPAGKTAYISAWSWGASSGASESAEFQLKAMVHEGALSTLWYGQDIAMIQDGSDHRDLSSPIKVPATASIKVSVKGSGSLAATASFAGWYE